MADKIGAYRQDILEYAKTQYHTEPEYLWMRYPNYAVLRHSDNKKWYAIIMDVKRDKLGLQGNEKTDILSIKCDPLMIGSLISEDGILPSYHMSKANWITVLLDGSVDKTQVFGLLQMSYELTKAKQKKKPRRTQPKEWIVPANPKYYDIESAFEKDDTILWKQSSSILVGDTVYIYMAAPVSAILYQCKAVEVNIPYDYDSDELSIHKAMKIKLTHRFEKDELTFKRLNEYGIFAVRGPRGVPNSLSHEIKRLCNVDEL